MAMTMTKLARLAGVSVSTVSKAFAGSEEISQEKREYIFNLAREMGCYDKFYKPNHHYHKTVIAVICPEFQSSYYAEQLALLEKEITKHNGIMLSCSTNFNPARADEIISYFQEYMKVDGIILYGSYNVRKSSLPIVASRFNKDADAICEKYDSICLSHSQAVVDAIKYFAENEHCDIAYLGDKYTFQICDFFKEAMKQCNIPVKEEYIVVSENRFELAGYEGMKQLLSLEKPPTAVLTGYDQIAIGAMRCIWDYGLKIPDDISIIGRNDISEAAYLNIPLTSISTYNEDYCQIVVEAIFEKIKLKDSCAKKKIRVSSGLIKRQSVGKAKKRT